jgi:hypothetical protein
MLLNHKTCGGDNFLGKYCLGATKSIVFANSMILGVSHNAGG